MAHTDPQILIVPVERTRTEYVTQTVNVNRAPTDESVALLKEMEKAARDKIEQSINVGGNDFECVVHIARDNMSDTTKVVAVFKLNGKQLRAEVSVPERKILGPADVVLPLRDEVARVIATEIVGPAFAKACRY